MLAAELCNRERATFIAGTARGAAHAPGALLTGTFEQATTFYVAGSKVQNATFMGMAVPKHQPGSRRALEAAPRRHVRMPLNNCLD